MPIELSWYIPKRVIRVHVYGEAGTEQLKQLVEGIAPYIENGNAPLHLLLDDAQAESPPLRLRELQTVLDVNRQSLEKIGWVIGVGDVNVIAKMVIPMLLKIIKLKYVRLDTLDEAIAFLKRQDMSLQTATT